MRLLIITQKVDESDSNLGFFVGWIKEFSRHSDILVIANEVGSYHLPDNVSVFSLWKERGAGKLLRFFRFQYFLLKYITRANGIFFHMCPEYVLATHVFPAFFGKRTALWYTHKEVSWCLRFAEKLVGKIFTASKESCRLRSKKIEVVGHGIDSNTNCLPVFALRQSRQAGEKDTKLRTDTETKTMRLVTVGRISPVKDLRTLIFGFRELKKRFPEAIFTIVGEPITAEDRAHFEELRRISSGAQFIGGVSHAELPRLLAGATAFVHASQTGSMDKSVLEALSAGLPVFSSSEAFSESISGIVKFNAGNADDLADKIARAFESGKTVISHAGSAYVKTHHSLAVLIKRIISFYE